MEARFRSKVDKNLQIVGLVTPLVALLAVATSFLQDGWPVRLLAVLTMAVAVVVVWVVSSTYYDLDDERLTAHSGPFSWRIPLASLTSVRRSGSLRSGPALSMDRLEVRWGERHVLLISPEDPERFLEALHRRAPQLVAGDRTGAPLAG